MSCLVWLFKPTGLDRETRERCHLKAKYFCLNQNQLLSSTIRFTIPTNLFQSPPLLLIIMQRQAKKQKSSVKTIPAWGDLLTSSWFAYNLSKWCCLRDVVFLRNVSNHLNVFFKNHLLYTDLGKWALHHHYVRCLDFHYKFYDFFFSTLSTPTLLKCLTMFKFHTK